MPSSMKQRTRRITDIAGTRRQSARGFTLRLSAQGFTLLELLVVITITVILAALIFPVFKSIRESNQLMSCTSHLQKIHTALKLYFTDEQGLPPCYLNPNESAGLDTATPYATSLKADGTPYPFGLHALMAGDYIRDESVYHCPRAVNVAPSDANFYQSYEERDVLASFATTDAYGAFNQYKYLSTRGIISGGTDYRRQLTDCVAPSASEKYPHPATQLDTTWQPDDATVVTWCDYHADSYTRGGFGQYNVLYWDGSVVCRDETQMRTGHQGPPSAAWRMDPQ